MNVDMVNRYNDASVGHEIGHALNIRTGIQQNISDKVLNRYRNPKLLDNVTDIVDGKRVSIFKPKPANMPQKRYNYITGKGNEAIGDEPTQQFVSIKKFLRDEG